MIGNSNVKCPLIITKMNSTPIFPLQYFTFCVLVVMVSCAVYQLIFCIIKLLLLVAICVAYLSMVLFTHGSLFDNQDALLLMNKGYYFYCYYHYYDFFCIFIFIIYLFLISCLYCLVWNEEDSFFLIPVHLS